MGERGPEYEPQLLPSALDIVRIDGRWAQVYGAGDEYGTIAYLDDGTGAHINWKEYELSRLLRSHVQLMQENEQSFTQEEMSRIHWGVEQKEHPHLIGDVRVFGEYKKKTAE